MSVRQSQKIFFIASIVLVLFSACNLPQGTPPPSQGPGAVYTAAAQTVSAQLTLAAGGTPQPATTATNTPVQADNPIYTETPTDSPHSIFGTPIGSPTPTAILPDHMTFVSDVTYPDNAQVSPGEVFTKTWRLENTGSNTWTSEYSLVFDHGDLMGASTTIQFTDGEVKPGETIDVSVELTAPDTLGFYQGFWTLRNADDELFGNGAILQTFWVKVNVEIGTGVMFNFNAFADEAAWGTGITPVDFSGPGADSLTFGPPANPGDPFADLRNNQKLENGRVSNWVLETYPPVGANNYIIGKYPSYTVKPGDHLIGAVGFITNPDESCGSGDVKFRISYTVDNDTSAVETLWDWADVCDGIVKEIKINLSDLADKEIQFYLLVIAHTSTDENYAFWNSLAVQR
ncbi:MAG: NBR1-Ig-like domain-containing protein [Chloroflexota bacterium]|nr:NBR1-Ig-like domain-containing protein [Chloroflexota bacterium]